MQLGPDLDFPGGNPDERELLLEWLGYLRGAIVRKIAGLSEVDARWRPDGRLTSLLGIINHLSHVVLYLINETARHAGHADATRELLDGTTGE